MKGKIYAMLVILLSCNICRADSSEDDTLLFMFWNLENFFDFTFSGSGESDMEFTPSGERRWTSKRFYAKCDAVAKGIFHIAETYGRMPDVIGVCEVENSGVLQRLLSHTLLRKYEYGIVHHDSYDRRGIDVAMIYRLNKVSVLSESVVTPLDNEGLPYTRDILHARIKTVDNVQYDVIVNHHPSKYGGEELSEEKRKSVMTDLGELCDSLSRDSCGIIAMGDFNDSPDARQFEIIDERLINMAADLYRKGEGTIRYEGRWELIDMFLASPDICGRCRMDIVRIPFLMTYDRKHPGYRPMRTYIGPRYSGGVSDHCPVVMMIL